MTRTLAQESINTSELIGEFAIKNNLNTEKAEEYVTSFLGMIHRYINSGKRVKLRDIGSFHWVSRTATKKKMPHGNIVNVPPKQAIVFKPSSSINKQKLQN